MAKKSKIYKILPNDPRIITLIRKNNKTKRDADETRSTGLRWQGLDFCHI
jgi:hypothetical protein